MRHGFIGYGELGRQIEGLVRAQRPAMQACYFDDPSQEQGIPGAYPFSSYREEQFAEAAFYVCLGYKHLKKN